MSGMGDVYFFIIVAGMALFFYIAAHCHIAKREIVSQAACGEWGVPGSVIFRKSRISGIMKGLYESKIW